MAGYPERLVNGFIPTATAAVIESQLLGAGITGLIYDLHTKAIDPSFIAIDSAFVVVGSRLLGNVAKAYSLLANKQDSYYAWSDKMKRTMPWGIGAYVFLPMNLFRVGNTPTR